MYIQGQKAVLPMEAVLEVYSVFNCVSFIISGDSL